MPSLQQRPDLTIIVPVYNLERFIQPLLNSLRMQDLGSYTVETIFVLNNCTDNSEQVIRDSGLDCKILTCETQGCGPARNTGLKAARGQYIWFLDGDDWLISTTAVRDVLDRVKAERLNILRVTFRSNKFSWQYFSMVWQYVFRREFIEDLRFPAIQPCEDDEFMRLVFNQIGCNHNTYIFLPTIEEPLYFYNYLREGSNMFRHYRGEHI